MTLSIAFFFLLLGIMVILFLSERLPVELTAFLGLLVLIFTGYVEPEVAFDGFSSPAVITMLSMFFLSAALLETGVADRVGIRIHRLAGGDETRLVLLLMAVAGVLSSVMNNVAVVALLLPATSSVARLAGMSPSRLFMPLSFGSVLGGTMTLVGTPPNILTAEVLAAENVRALKFFDFAPIGLAVLAFGMLYMVTIGRRLLPERVEPIMAEASSRLTGAYRMEERLTSLRVPHGSKLDGLRLRDTRLGSALDVSVLAVRRGDKKIMAPRPDWQLQGDDLLLVDGRFADLERLLSVQGMLVQEIDEGHLDAVEEQVHGAVVRLPAGSGLVGRSLRQLHFRERFGVLVVGIRRGRDMVRQELARRVLRETDELLVLGTPASLAGLHEQKGLQVIEETAISSLLDERLFSLRVPSDSPLVGTTIRDSRLGELAGVTVLGRVRDGRARLVLVGDEPIQPGDEMLVVGQPTRLMDLFDLGHLELRDEVPRARLESPSVRVLEAVVAPRSPAAGKNLRELHFRDRYGLQVLAIWRAGEAIHQEIASISLRVGDALLLHGPIEKLGQLAPEEFVVLSSEVTPARRPKAAPVAIGSMLLMIGLVASGLYPVHVAAFAAAASVVLFGALKMPEAYRAVEWRVLFLVAAILPMGAAMESSGAAGFVASGVADIARTFGTYPFLIALVVVASLLSQTLDGTLTVVVLAPVVIQTAAELGVDATPLMMCVGLAASAAFMTPFSHKAHLLVTSAGGYRSQDFLRVGTPLTLAMLGLLVILVPIFFPL
ncbi:MAG: SLC13 family permease [Acidobacteriota bacterium]